MADPNQMAQALLGQNQAQQSDTVGLAQNPPNIPFQCGTCGFFQNGVCGNPDKRLNGKQVQSVWCCNKYDHKGMRTIIN